MIIEPAKLLPLRFIDTENINDSFDGNFANEQIPEWMMGEKCYLQKFQRNDRLVLQLISDEPLSDLNILRENGNVAALLAWEVSDLTIVGFPDYRIYQIDYDLSLLTEGIYVVKQDDYEAQAIDLRNEHPNTLRVTYNNSENDKDVIFDTGIIFQFRVEAWIGNYVPKNQRDVYTNQIYDPTQLKSIAHRQFTLSIGFQTGVPDWIIDKVNIITQCDEVLYNGIKYQPINDAEFEVITENLVAFKGATIDIEPANKYNKFITGGNPQEQTFTPVQKVDPYFNQSATLVVAGKFKKYSLLEKITVDRYSVGDFVIRIGTTNGGNEIGEFTIDEAVSVKMVEWTFTEPTTVYITGLVGQDCDLHIIWKQLDEPPVPFVANPLDTLKKGAKILWEGTEAEFGATWEISTGLGKPNSGWQKWTIAGKNGTTSMDNAFPIGIDTSVVGQDYLSLGDSVGNNTKAIAKANLPAVGVGLFTATVNTGGGTPGTGYPVARARSVGGQILNYEIAVGSGTVYVGESEPMGSGTGFDVTPNSVYSLWVVKIED